MNINLIADKESLNRTKLMLAGLGNLYSPVLSRAINKTLTTVRARAVDELYLKLNLRQITLRETFSFNKASYQKPSGDVVSRGKPVPLIDFVGTRQLARGGVSVQIKRGGERYKLIHAFIATMKSGHVGVFERQGGNFGRPYNILKNYAALPKKFRLPIDELYSLRITDEYAKPVVLEPVLQHAGDAYQKNVEHELDYAMSQL